MYPLKRGIDLLIVFKISVMKVGNSLRMTIPKEIAKRNENRQRHDHSEKEKEA